jgi:hypothetical protein
VEERLRQELEAETAALREVERAFAQSQLLQEQTVGVGRL